MKILKYSVLILFFCLYNTIVAAQENSITYTFKKGEVLDILLLSQKPNAGKLFERYKKTAFPVAIKMSYTFIPGFKISSYTQGNHQPNNFLFGKWSSIEKREKFLKVIEKEVPDFHEQRRAIFKYFGLVYYEITKDITFSINRDKYIVVTAYWKKEETAFKTFKQEWKKLLKRKEGKKILELSNGKSPLGYDYNPEFLIITEWENEAVFNAFKKENLQINHKGVQHVHQFVIN